MKRPRRRKKTGMNRTQAILGGLGMLGGLALIASATHSAHLKEIYRVFQFYDILLYEAEKDFSDELFIRFHCITGTERHHLIRLIEEFKIERDLIREIKTMIP